MMNPFDNIDTLGWVLLAVVVLSLAFSVVALIIQFTRKRSQNTPPQGPGAHQHPYGAAPNMPQPPIQQHPVPPPPVPPTLTPPPPAYPPSHQPWQEIPEDKFDQTMSLFSDSLHPSNVAVNAGQARGSGYRVSMREISEKGARNYEVTVDGEFHIGRLGTNHLQIGNATVSGLQCVLTPSQDGVYITNRSNSNITLLNGAKLVDMRALKPGDTLHLGKVQIMILDIGKNAAY